MKVCQKSIVRFLVSLIIGTFVISVPFMANAQPDRELRAVWIASVLNIDWPSKRFAGGRAKARVYQTAGRCTKMGMNAVIVQIKPTADAFIRPLTDLGLNT